MAKLMFQAPSVKREVVELFRDITGGEMSSEQIFSVIDELDEIMTGTMMLPPKKRLKAAKKVQNTYRALLEKEIESLNPKNKKPATKTD